MTSRLATAILVLAFAPVLTWAQDFAESSVLMSGKWRKVSVTKSGVYRLTTSDLLKMGFPDPASVRVYGAGGRQLKSTVGADSRDDLKLIPAHHDSQGVVFYAEGPDVHSLQPDGCFLPFPNVFSRKAYYFITTSSADDSYPPGPAAMPPADAQPLTAYDNIFIYAPQTQNISSTGCEWVGQKLTFAKQSLTLTPDIPLVEGAEVRFAYRFCYNLNASRSVTLSLNDAEVVTKSISKTTQSYALWSYIAARDAYTPGESVLRTATVSAPLTNADDGLWVSYLSFTAESPLDAASGSLLFRSVEQSRSASDVVFKVDGFPSDAIVLDVTDPQAQSRVATSPNGSSATFSSPGRSLHEFALFSPSASLPSPADEGDVPNSNIHSHNSVNYLVVTSPLFADVADKFCELHERAQGLSGRVVFTSDIYNEFSGGRAEPAAIRNYIKMLYDRGLGSQSQLKSVLLLGDGTYDNFDPSNDRNIIPTYQTENSYNGIYSYPIEDFYGWLEDGEALSQSQSTLDVGVGRLPVQTVSEAESYYAKVQRYMESPCQGDWRAKALFVGYQGDSNEHQSYANAQAQNFEQENPDMETIRVFAEAYPAVTQSSGTSYPQSITEAQNVASSGCSLFHYTGHGGSSFLGGPYISLDFAANLSNTDKLFVFVAASCHTSSFDQGHHTIMSKGLFNPNGGYVATFGATRDVYGNGNYSITRQFVKYLYSKDSDGRRITIGEAARLAKHYAIRGASSIKFILLADPAVVISTPSDGYVMIDSVNSEPADAQSLPLQALAASVLKGSVRTPMGDVDTTFNGMVRLTLYDKPITRQTSGVGSGVPMSWEEHGPKLFSGKVNVSNGRFSSSFILSKEFDLNAGYGRALMYASADDGRDAMGATDAVLIGGMSDANLTDTIGPEITAWVDYNLDSDGRPTSSTPILYLKLTDPQGINLSGQGVGHDISLIIDSNRAGAVSLNDYFSYSPDDFSKGTVAYPLSDVSLATHSFTIKAWDNLNNSSSATFLINLDPSCSKIRVENESISISDDLKLTVRSDAFGGSLSVRSGLYTLGGVLVAHQNLALPQRNGEIITTIPVAPRLPAPGVYVLHVAVSGGGRKAEISKKILIGRQ
ncbi:MAG: type IX secretion system sortase PorU [Bacteroidales bacterium]|nr:type IX secretion system sortase PorU [Bacteroidales bacterium]